MSTVYDLVWARYGKRTDEQFMRELRATMRTHGITQADLSKRSGYHPTHICRWMGGKVGPSLETKLVLDEALDRLVKETNHG